MRNEMSRTNFKKGDFLFRRRNRYPYRDAQQEELGFCPGCGGQLYAGEEDGTGLCPCCRRRRKQEEENAMT